MARHAPINELMYNNPLQRSGQAKTFYNFWPCFVILISELGWCKMYTALHLVMKSTCMKLWVDGRTEGDYIVCLTLDGRLLQQLLRHFLIWEPQIHQLYRSDLLQSAEKVYMSPSLEDMFKANPRCTSLCTNDLWHMLISNNYHISHPSIPHLFSTVVYDLLPILLARKRAWPHRPLAMADSRASWTPCGGKWEKHEELSAAGVIFLQ